MTVEVLACQARAHAKQTGESFEDALERVLEAEAGRQRVLVQEGLLGLAPKCAFQG